MGFFDAIKNRLGTNLKFVQLSYMTQPGQIVQFCQTLTPAERTAMLKGIESSFRWQPVAQIAQALYPALHSHTGVSDAAKDLVLSGNVDAGLRLMRSESQAAAAPPQMGMQSSQQAALSFAWIVLKAIEEEA